MPFRPQRHGHIMSFAQFAKVMLKLCHCHSMTPLYPPFAETCTLESFCGPLAGFTVVKCMQAHVSACVCRWTGVTSYKVNSATQH